MSRDGGYVDVPLEDRLRYFVAELNQTSRQIVRAHTRGGRVTRNQLTLWNGTIQHAQLMLAELRGAMEAYQMLALVQKAPSPRQAAPDTTIETGPAPEVYGVA